MRRQSIRPINLLLACVLFAGCSSATEGFPSTIAIARSRWVASTPQDYTFDVHMTCECLYASLHVQVANSVMIGATELDGKPAPHFSMTLEDLWTSILSARGDGSLHSASFDRDGVPLAADIGELANDAGARYSVTNYHRTR